MPRQFHSPEELFEPAPLLRRLLAMLYDGLICIAVVMVVSWAFTMAHAWIIGFDQYIELAEAGEMDSGPGLTFSLVLVLYLFFAYFWTRTGQTLGMQVWRIRVETHYGRSISWTQALIRFLTGIASWLLLGLGYFWMLWDDTSETWPDKASGTQVVRVPPGTKIP
ncbi:Uncharacterized membrane protein YckC, RDD family [Marinobacter daqiaonensis]|uniref:Uncharacterized membrane protein YckC, RDD family n=1 Tax=Marinobacter daqiaonensis TaxID=650891 RepID=A0A1I6GGL0_9GAMM|nr:RDD family protein [Marinobacter daqiaonensis]SFR41288.1 Uncharacterized membrane protein YckC, RDD family [Marinobacter daqiaonensis]